MHYFNGFGLEGEEIFLKPHLDESPFTVAGFSYGAILALEFALSTKSRIDLLQLFSPAFLQNKSMEFKQKQIKQFQENHKLYMRQFLKACAYPSNINLKNFQGEASLKKLQFLFDYQWTQGNLKQLKTKNIYLEVFLAAKDKIIDTEQALAFFKPFAKIFYFKTLGHILQA